MSEFTLFWQGPFSQWHPSEFVIDGVTYCCCEQYMMAEKARLFKDEAVLKEIMNAKDPARHKYLGRRVKGFIKDKWEAVAKDIVFKANLAKFSQNKKLKETLINTKDSVIAEASPYDTIWGIGLKASDPRAKDRTKWRGKNWLGEALMKVREQFKK